MAADTLYGVMTLFETDFDTPPPGPPGDPARIEYMKAWLDDAAGLGTQIIRYPGDWIALEPLEGVFDQGAVSENIQIIEYAASLGMQVIFEFGQTPEWARPGNETEPFTPPADPQDYANAAAYLHQAFIDAGVDQYISAWEIWNEPNVTLFWPGADVRNELTGDQSLDAAVDYAAAQEYVAMLNAAYSALHNVATANNTEITVLGGSLAGTDFEYLQWMLQEGAQMDGISVHPYTRAYTSYNSDPLPASPTDDPTLYDEAIEDPELSSTLNERWSFQYGMETIHQLLVNWGLGDTGVWITEMGWRIEDFNDGDPDDDWLVVDEATQAQYMAEAFDLIEDWDWLEAVTVFQLYDADDGDWGLLNPDGSWRLSAQELFDHIQDQVGNSATAPEAYDDGGFAGSAGEFVVAEDYGTATIDVLANDSDPNGDPLTITHINGEALSADGWTDYIEGLGLVQRNGDNTLTVHSLDVPAGDFIFSYTVSDGTETATADVYGTIVGSSAAQSSATTSFLEPSLEPDADDEGTDPNNGTGNSNHAVGQQIGRQVSDVARAMQGLDVFVFKHGTPPEAFYDFGYGYGSEPRAHSNASPIGSDVDDMIGYHDPMSETFEPENGVTYDLANGDLPILSGTQLAALDQDAFTFF